ncbi:GntR family transcriptional regulator [Paenibacillus validus]|uniref:GntR family transcriptional regulator n=1 Tax=Paenibacillus TaxID=44249 RepID=UPI0012D86C3C|nr:MULTISPECIES: GntR family transcriptional regulator [Paenibacillus]MED4600469.1 GntR family transcriptional regulator [Paenibacillus validus]MED4604728.1 GntR family transcriptional regulator [Paenibacillus validus]
MSSEKDIKREQVFDYIYNAIHLGEIRPGQTLSERTLSIKLGVSRTPIREAFRQLENLGLVKSEPHKGVTVTSISGDQLKQLYQIREVLEGLGARILAENRNEEVLAALTNLLKEAEQAVQQEDIYTLSKINTQFHLAIASGTKNIYLENMMQTLQIHLRLLMSTSLSSSGRPKENLKEHWMIVKAIESGDPELAETVASFHIRNAYKTILAKF